MEEIITTSKEFKNIENNTFEGKVPKMTNSKIIFKGKNNILYIEDGVQMENSTIIFNGSDSIIYQEANRYII